MIKDELSKDSGLTDTQEFKTYQKIIIHQWSRTLTALGFTLVPLFYILDYFTLPVEMLPRFALYRAISTVIIIIQYMILRNTKPNILSYLHGYFFTFIVGGVIVLMTADLGGFDARYYAGLNLVIIAVTLLLPIGAIHSALNGFMIISFYVLWNLFTAKSYYTANVVSNLFFLSATVVISVSINYVRSKLIKTEFFSRSELQDARDALWSEMELAKKIQTSLLPDQDHIGGYEVAGMMIPASEVGGDYYDIIETRTGEHWVSIGDVSGHGLESGLIMMMTQTSLFSMINNTSGHLPSTVIEYVNYILRKNLRRLGSTRYMTLLVIRLDKSSITFSGCHQDVLIYHNASRWVEAIPTQGSWIGLADNISNYLLDTSIKIETGDLILLFTDGATEAGGKKGEMFGQERLERLLDKYAKLKPADIVKKIADDVIRFHDEQYDDITLLALRKK